MDEGYDNEVLKQKLKDNLLQLENEFIRCYRNEVFVLDVYLFLVLSKWKDLIKSEHLLCFIHEMQQIIGIRYGAF